MAAVIVPTPLFQLNDGQTVSFVFNIIHILYLFSTQPTFFTYDKADISSASGGAQHNHNNHERVSVKMYRSNGNVNVHKIYDPLTTTKQAEAFIMWQHMKPTKTKKHGSRQIVGLDKII